ncbi:hypothetical protein [Promicromonospora soli]|uniref:Uncharacterized protein n=1 Tax=Promicromonospora soli TaxID=2035533 RepID=A0A919G6V7_9MICO|nr:hypothetical protein [Promicromonospora soli]GHH79148.1 hypothetical protein GCM10017772_44190 [Promicromonospora soli]
MNFVWATRGRSWGFRFLRDGGFPDPLPVYDHAFAGTEDEPTTYRRVGTQVALRFPDPDGRSDEAGRVIPHDIVVLPPLADDIRSVDDGQRIVWPLIADAFKSLWDLKRPLSATDIRRAFGDDPASLGSDEEHRP